MVGVVSGQQVALIPVSGDPFRVIVSSDGARLYATSNADRVLIINAAQGAVGSTITVGGAPNGLALSPNEEFLHVVVVSPAGDEVYVACLEGAVEIRRGSDLGAIATVPEAGGGFGMALSPDGEQLYATQPRSSRIAVVDRRTRRLVATIPVCGRPRRIRFSPGGETAVVADEAGYVVFIR